MQAGKIRHLVSLEEATATQNTTGEEILLWSEAAAVWAGIEPLRGNELFAAQQVNAEVTHRVCLRHAGGVHPKMRVRFGTRLFDILSVRNLDERLRELELACKERV